MPLPRYTSVWICIVAAFLNVPSAVALGHWWNYASMGFCVGSAFGCYWLVRARLG